MRAANARAEDLHRQLEDAAAAAQQAEQQASARLVDLQAHIEQLTDRARRAEDAEARARHDLEHQVGERRADAERAAANERRLLQEIDRDRVQANAARAQAQREVDAARKQLAHIEGQLGEQTARAGDLERAADGLHGAGRRAGAAGRPRPHCSGRTRRTRRASANSRPRWTKRASWCSSCAPARAPTRKSQREHQSLSRSSTSHSPGTEARSWQPTSASRCPLTSRCTSVILRALGSAGLTRTPMGCSGSTCPRAWTSQATRRPAWMRSREN